MLLKSSNSDDARFAEITPRDLYLNRRKFLAGVGLSAVAAAGLGGSELFSPSAEAAAEDKIAGLQKSPFSTTEKITPVNDVTHFFYYYAATTEKEEPAKLSKNFKTHPW